MARPQGTYKFTPEELKCAWIEYREKCDRELKQVVSAGKILSIKQPRVYTIEEFCDYAGLHRDTFYSYAKLDDYSDTTKGILDAVFARKQSALVNGEGNTTGLIFDMKANYGINEKTYVEHSGSMTFNASNLSDDDLLKLAEIQNKAIDKGHS